MPLRSVTGSDPTEQFNALFLISRRKKRLCFSFGSDPVIIGLVCLLWIGGCRRKPVSPVPPLVVVDPLGFITPELARAAGKTAVFCLQGSAAARRRTESRGVQAMKSHGVEALEGSVRFHSEHEYSADLLA